MKGDGIGVQAIHEVGKGMREDVGKDLEKDVGDEVTRGPTPHVEATTLSVTKIPLLYALTVEEGPVEDMVEDWTEECMENSALCPAWAMAHAQYALFYVDRCW